MLAVRNGHDAVFHWIDALNIGDIWNTGTDDDDEQDDDDEDETNDNST